VVIVVEALDGGILDGPVHALDLSVGPWMLNPGEPVLDAVLVADPVEDVVESVFVAGLIGELDAVVGQHRMDGVGSGCDEIAQELGCIHLAGFGIELSESEPGRAVNRYKEIQLAFGRLHLGNVDVEVADRVGLERSSENDSLDRFLILLNLRLLVTLDIGQAADAMALQAAMQ